MTRNINKTMKKKTVRAKSLQLETEYKTVVRSWGMRVFMSNNAFLIDV